MTTDLNIYNNDVSAELQTEPINITLNHNIVSISISNNQIIANIVNPPIEINIATNQINANINTSQINLNIFSTVNDSFQIASPVDVSFVKTCSSVAPETAVTLFKDVC